jgi:septal ring factor EnvC (AmiA/AmiB activator)
MNTILIILALAAVAVGVVYFLTKSGKIKDTDGDNIPDTIEESIEKVNKTFAETKVKVEKVKEQVADVTKAVKKVAKEMGEVADVAQGKEVPVKKKRRYYKPKTNKQ